jgi:microcystin-dependent protein
VTLNITQIPSHAHPLNSEAKLNVNNATNSDTTSPGGAVLAKSRENTYLSSGAVDATLNGAAISGQTGNVGGNQSHDNMQPYQVLRWLVALVGIYPSRN